MPSVASSAAPAADPSQPPSAALIEAELQRLAASSGFRRSPRHVRFLRHLIDATREGDTARLREMVLGVEVFLRSADRFDPRRDTIVRVEARRLRHKLAHYYAHEGLDARLEFVLPVGGYELQIRRREIPDDGSHRRSSVAVFALRLDDGAADGAPLVASLGAELAALLARLNGLRVVPAGDAPAGGDSAALRHATARLKVDNVLLGGVARQGSQLLLELRLLRAGDGSALWSRHTQLDADRALHALEPLARGIISVLHRDAAQRQLRRIQLAGSRPYVHALAGGGPTAEGIELMGLARIAMRGNSIEGYRKAVQLAEQAVNAMPGHAPAFSLLAEALIANVSMTLLPAEPTLVAARHAADRALDLDSELPDAHGQRGYLYFIHQRDWESAEPRMLEALRLAPAWPPSHARYGWALMMHGRFAEARACYAEARDLDPLSLNYRVHDALIAHYERDWQRAAQGFDAVLEVAPTHVVALALRAAVHLASGRLHEALAAYQRMSEQFPSLSIGLCGSAQARALIGDEAGARAELARLQAACEAGYVSPYQMAMVHTRLGDDDQALARLQEAAALSDFNFVCVAMDPTFDRLRPLPAFGALLRDNGFAHLAAA